MPYYRKKMCTWFSFKILKERRSELYQQFPLGLKRKMIKQEFTPENVFSTVSILLLYSHEFSPLPRDLLINYQNLALSKHWRSQNLSEHIQLLVIKWVKNGMKITFQAKMTHFHHTFYKTWVAVCWVCSVIHTYLILWMLVDKRFWTVFVCIFRIKWDCDCLLKHKKYMKKILKIFFSDICQAEQRN